MALISPAQRRGVCRLFFRDFHGFHVGDVHVIERVTAGHDAAEAVRAMLIIFSDTPDRLIISRGFRPFGFCHFAETLSRPVNDRRAFRGLFCGAGFFRRRGFIVRDTVGGQCHRPVAAHKAVMRGDHRTDRTAAFIDADDGQPFAPALDLPARLKILSTGDHTAAFVQHGAFIGQAF